MILVERSEERYEQSNTTLFLVLGAISYCERATRFVAAAGGGAPATARRAVKGEPPDDPVTLIMLGLESFARSLESLRGTKPPARPRARPPRDVPTHRGLLR